MDGMRRAGLGWAGLGGWLDVDVEGGTLEKRNVMTVEVDLVQKTEKMCPTAWRPIFSFLAAQPTSLFFITWTTIVVQAAREYLHSIWFISKAFVCVFLLFQSTTSKHVTLNQGLNELCIRLGERVRRVVHVLCHMCQEELEFPHVLDRPHRQHRPLQCPSRPRGRQ